MHVRQAGAVFFKNLAKQHWDVDSGGEGSIGEAIKTQASVSCANRCPFLQHSPATDAYPPRLIRHSQCLRVFLHHSQSPRACGKRTPPITQVRDGLLSLFLCVAHNLQMQLSEVTLSPAPNKLEAAMPSFLSQFRALASRRRSSIRAVPD